MEKYHVFLSCCIPDDAPPAEKQMAEALYWQLQRKFLNVFYYPITLRDRRECDTPEEVETALENSLVFVAVAARAEHLQTSLISAFRYELLYGSRQPGTGAMISYVAPGFPREKLPSALRNVPSFQDADQVVSFVLNHLARNGSLRRRALDGTGTTSLPAPAGAHLCDDPAPVEEGHRFLDRYRVLRPLGKGGMANVYLAADEKTQKNVAVKMVHYTDTRLRQILRQELSAEVAMLRQLDHPGVVKLQDFADSDSSALIVMDYIAGDSLAEHLQKNGPLPEDKLLDVARQLVQVLSYLHAHGVIYRDLKPGNVILQPDGRLVLIDFGSAREYTPGCTEDALCLGTRGYAAPEQYGGMGQTDARTDFYGLGATLHHLATGKKPEEPPCVFSPVRQYRPELSHGLEYVIERCVRRDPDTRFQSEAELANALKHMGSLTHLVKRRQILTDAPGSEDTSLFGDAPMPKVPPYGDGFGRTRLLSPNMAAVTADGLCRVWNLHPEGRSPGGKVGICLCAKSCLEENDRRTELLVVAFSAEHKEEALDLMTRYPEYDCVTALGTFYALQKDVIIVEQAGGERLHFVWLGSCCSGLLPVNLETPSATLTAYCGVVPVGMTEIRFE